MSGKEKHGTHKKLPSQKYPSRNHPSENGKSTEFSTAPQAGPSKTISEGANSNHHNQWDLGVITSATPEERYHLTAIPHLYTSTKTKIEDKNSHAKSASSDPVHIFELPDGVIEKVFAFLSIENLPIVLTVCSKWNNIMREENNEVWRTFCNKTIPSQALQSDLLNPLGSWKTKLRAFYHAWNPTDCSRNIVVKPNGFTIHRNPVAQSTDGVRGKIGFTTGRHVWQVVWEGPLGTVAVVGIANRRADMRAQGYIALLGHNEHSWGWNLVDNSILHNGDSLGSYPLIRDAPRYRVGEQIRVILDCDEKTLSFEKDFEFMGVAFYELPTNVPLYPSISAVYGNTEVSMIYLGPLMDETF